MNHNRVINTAVLFLLLGTTLPAFAQKGEEQKGGGGEKAQPAQHEAQQKQQPQRAQQAKVQPQRAEKAQPQRAEKAQPQRAEKAQPQRAEKAQPQRAQQSRGQQPQAVANNRGRNAGHYGRISDTNYRAHFGHDHSFHMGRPRRIGGYNRFQYGGYWFGFNEGWPVGWDYNDDFYVEYIDGAYYMFDLRHPGFRLTLNIF